MGLYEPRVGELKLEELAFVCGRFFPDAEHHECETRPTLYCTLSPESIHHIQSLSIQYLLRGEPRIRGGSLYVPKCSFLQTSPAVRKKALQIHACFSAPAVAVTETRAPLPAEYHFNKRVPGTLT